MLYQMLSKITKRDMSIRYCSTNWKTIACMIYMVGGGTFAQEHEGFGNKDLLFAVAFTFTC